MRLYMYGNFKRFPWHWYIRAAYNDALTFDPATGKGGAVANYRSPKVMRHKANRDIQGFINEIIYKKECEFESIYDKISTADLFQLSAMIAIKESQGPDMFNSMVIGRKEIEKPEDAGSPSNIPKAENFKEQLLKLNFDEDEICALAAIDAYT